jgi:NACalpha-BTF3-like transcription factor
MTKQPKTEYVPAGKVVHVTREMMDNDAVRMALDEQLFAIQGPTSIASLLAWRLRQPSPSRVVLNQIARMLDPSEDSYLKLKVVRQKKGKTATKYVNDVAIAKAVKKNMEARGNKHGAQKKAVAAVAEQFEVSKASVLKAIRSK